jgi:hypothetical protein
MWFGQLLAVVASIVPGSGRDGAVLELPIPASPDWCISPLPLLIALNGVTVALFSYMGRLTFSPSTAPRLPDKVPSTLNCPDRLAVSSIDRLVEWPVAGSGVRQKMWGLRDKIMMFAALLLAAIGFVTFMGLAPKMLESRTVQLVLPATLFLVLIDVLWDLTMAAVLWSRLKVTSGWAAAMGRKTKSQLLGANAYLSDDETVTKIEHPKFVMESDLGCLPSGN